MKRLQRKVSRKYEKSREVNNRYLKSQNILKLEQQIRLVHRRVHNIRNNYIHQITADCGTIKKDLKLSDRVFKCECGYIMDRDLNASINLANYRVS